MTADGGRLGIVVVVVVTAAIVVVVDRFAAHLARVVTVMQATDRRRRSLRSAGDDAVRARLFAVAVVVVRW